MSYCVVTCTVCRVDGKPRKWRHGCQDCATAQQAEHGAATGHHTHLHMIAAVTAEELATQIRRAPWWEVGW